MQKFIKVLRALSDETRLRILHILMQRECCVCEVTQSLSISESCASRNLHMLYDAGILGLRKDGLWSFYSIDKENMPEYAKKLIEAARLALAGQIILQEDIEHLKSIKVQCQSKRG